jgi:hypothetical protein
MRKRNIILLMLAAMVLIGSAVPARAEIKAEQGTGILSSVEPDGSVVISELGYLVSPYAIVRDGSGQRVNLKDLTLPLPVKFEFGHSPKGPVIRVIKVLPQ